MKSWAVAIVLIVVLCAEIRSLSVQIDAHKEECFYQYVKKEGKLGVYFQVAQGGFLDIDCTVWGPDNRQVHTVERESEGRFSVHGYETGIYKVCFSNKMSTMTPKTVIFQVHPGDRLEYEELAKLEQLSPIEESLLRLADALADIQTEQLYLRNRERVHRNMAESTNARVLWWSFFEALILMAMTAWQVYYITRYFEVKEQFRHV